jgi:hypothetical protein
MLEQTVEGFFVKSKLVNFKAVLNTADKVTRLSVCYCFTANLYHKFTYEDGRNASSMV